MYTKEQITQIQRQVQINTNKRVINLSISNNTDKNINKYRQKNR